MMKRKRKQSGQVVQSHGGWFVRFYESRVIDGVVKRVRVAKLLGEVTTRGKRPPTRPGTTRSPALPRDNTTLDRSCRRKAARGSGFPDGRCITTSAWAKERRRRRTSN